MLGDCQTSLGFYKEAKANIEEALQMLQSIYQDDHEEVGKWLRTLGRNMYQ